MLHLSSGLCMHRDDVEYLSGMAEQLDKIRNGFRNVFETQIWYTQESSKNNHYLMYRSDLRSQATISVLFWRSEP